MKPLSVSTIASACPREAPCDTGGPFKNSVHTTGHSKGERQVSSATGPRGGARTNACLLESRVATQSVVFYAGSFVRNGDRRHLLEVFLADWSLLGTAGRIAKHGGSWFQYS